jgi:hypothetical protein
MAKTPTKPTAKPAPKPAPKPTAPPIVRETEPDPVAATPAAAGASKVVQIAVDLGATGDYVLVDIPAGFGAHDRIITYQGKRLEHVGEHQGVWAYR